MARNLNKNRIQHTKLALVLCFFLVMFTSQLIVVESPLHEAGDMLGYFFIALCVMGRIYSTAFLGGHKNQSLITYGPFAMTRNPLYFASFLGACGIGLMSGHLLLIILVPALYCLIFFAVIRREEVFLLEHFGDSYHEYCKTVPRFFPSPALYHAPESVPMVPRFLLKAMRDALVWFLAPPLFEVLEWVSAQGWIKPLFVLY